MDALIRNLVHEHFGREPTEIKALGGGFYGRAFSVAIDRPPFTIVVKVYMYDGIARNEYVQLRMLARHALLKVPEVYHLHIKQGDSDHDALLMEHIEGLNAGHQNTLADDAIDRIADRIVDNLIAFHSVEHADGFGALESEAFEQDWRDWYRRDVRMVYKKAIALRDRGKLDNDIFATVELAVERFDQIFYLPITDARLIHGDYNAWNIMVNTEASDAIAVIDPFNCSWADPEFDLYQLDNANGRYLSLLDRYREKVALTENFAQKNSFYKLFTEIMHHHDANVDIATSMVHQAAKDLRKLIRSLSS